MSTINHCLLWQLVNTLFYSFQTLRFVDMDGRSFSLTATSTSHTAAPGRLQRGSVGCTAPTWPASCHRRSKRSSMVSHWGAFEARLLLWRVPLYSAVPGVSGPPRNHGSYNDNSLISLQFVIPQEMRLSWFRPCFTCPIHRQTMNMLIIDGLNNMPSPTWLTRQFWILKPKWSLDNRTTNDINHSDVSSML